MKRNYLSPGLHSVQRFAETHFLQFSLHLRYILASVRKTKESYLKHNVITSWLNFIGCWHSPALCLSVRGLEKKEKVYAYWKTEPCMTFYRLILVGSTLTVLSKKVVTYQGPDSSPQGMNRCMYWLLHEGKNLAGKRYTDRCDYQCRIRKKENTSYSVSYHPGKSQADTQAHTSWGGERKEWKEKQVRDSHLRQTVRVVYNWQPWGKAFHKKLRQKSEAEKLIDCRCVPQVSMCVFVPTLNVFQKQNRPPSYTWLWV